MLSSKSIHEPNFLPTQKSSHSLKHYPKTKPPPPKKSQKNTHHSPLKVSQLGPPPPKKNTHFFSCAENLCCDQKVMETCHVMSGIVTILSLFLSCGPWAPRSFLFVSYFGPLFRLGQVLGQDGPKAVGECRMCDGEIWI